MEYKQYSDVKILEEIEQLSDEEISQFIEDTNNEYNEWNINFPNLVDNLKDTNKIFLNDLIENDEIDFNKIIAKLKREVASLKKKLSQPQYI